MTDIYARLSLDRAGDELGVKRQVEACRKLADERGWTVRNVFVDNDISATNGKTRPAFEQLLISNPERIVVWHTDRLVRLSRDLERVIGLEVDVHAVTAGHLDLSNPAGRAVARTITAWATYEGEQKVLRQRAANDQRAAAGLPFLTQRPFGFEPDGMQIRESEAAVLREAAERVLSGHALRSIAADLNARGIATAKGNRWHKTTLKAALISPRNAGLRRHRGEVVGKAAWPAILDETTATAVRAILTDPARSQRGRDRRYLLSGIMSCAVCGGQICGAYIKRLDYRTYRCKGPIHVSRKADPVDEYVTGLAVARLNMPDAVDLFGRPDHSEELTLAREQLSTVRSRRDGLAEAFAVGDIDRQALAAGTKRLDRRSKELTATIAELAADPVLSQVATADDVEATFYGLPLDTQRAAIDAIMTLRLARVGGGHVDPLKGVQVEWKGQA